MTNQEAADLIRIAQAEIEWDYPMEYAIAFDKAIEALERTRWRDAKTEPPKSGEHVLATCEIRLLNGSKKRYVCEAYHAEKHSISGCKYLSDTDCYDYSEEDDEYYLKEGWYEAIHNWDEYESVVIEDFVTHWMPLPELPKEGE